MKENSIPDVICQGYRHKFCETDNSHCARFVVAQNVGRECVPADLGPHEESKAIQVLQLNGINSAYQLFT